MSELTRKLHKIVSAVYLACDPEPAEDISKTVLEAAQLIVKYELWFKDNASVLAVHNIGGYGVVEDHQA